MYDILIREANIIDGSGKPAYKGNIAVKNGRIICNSQIAEAKTEIDAGGLFLAPGFIDAHSHNELVLDKPVGQISKVSQGVTTELTGQCGSSLFPVSEDLEKIKILRGSEGSFSSENMLDNLPEFKDLNGFLNFAQQHKLANNFKTMTGHNALRIAVMGFDNRKPSQAELEHMKTLLRKCMEQGAAGLSSGLFYYPSGFADIEEITELCKVVAEYDGIYATHMRNEASEVVRSVEESIEVAERSGCRLNISHHKICGKDNWGLSEKTLDLVDKAVAKGMRITLDVYPYTASLTGLNVCLPKWFFEFGPEGMKHRLLDPKVRRDLIPEIIAADTRYRHAGGFGNMLMSTAPNTPECCGLTLEKYAEKLGIDPFDAFFDILAANGHAAMCIYFTMSEDDLSRIVCNPNTVIGSDSSPRSLSENSHPRAFGTFPRAIRKFVKEQKLLSLEEMVHKMTGLTAEQLLVSNKGFIRDGYDADLVLFDFEKLTDCADYVNWRELSNGIEKVIVNGEIVYSDKKLTGVFPGRFILHPVKKHLS